VRRDIERPPGTPVLQSSGVEGEPIHTGNTLAHVAGHGRGSLGNQVIVFPCPNPASRGILSYATGQSCGHASRCRNAAARSSQQSTFHEGW